MGNRSRIDSEYPVWMSPVFKGLFGLIVSNGIGLVSLLSVVPANISNKQLLKVVSSGMDVFALGFYASIIVYVTTISFLILGPNLEKVSPKWRRAVFFTLTIQGLICCTLSISGLCLGIEKLISTVKALAAP